MKQYPFYFNTVNRTKVAEIREVFDGKINDFEFLDFSVMEVLSENIEVVIKAKAIEAYKKCRVPVLVEHGGLIIKYLMVFPEHFRNQCGI